MAELEQENDSLRSSLGLPPANRPPLGRGPTGKDKAKPYERANTSSTTGTRISKEEEGSASPLTNHSSPSSTTQHIPGTHLGEGSGSLWPGDSSLSFPPSNSGYREPSGLHPLDTGGPIASSSYSNSNPSFRFGGSQSSKSRSSLSGGGLFPPPGQSGYHASANIDRPSTAASTFSRDEPFYSVAGMSSAHGTNSSLRGLGGEGHHHPGSSSMHSSPHHHMDSALGGGGQSPLNSHAHYTPVSPVSSGPPPVSLSLAMGLRRSIHDPPQHPSSPYVNAYHSAPYPQRAQPPFPHHYDPTSPRLSPGQSSGRP